MVEGTFMGGPSPMDYSVNQPLSALRGQLRPPKRSDNQQTTRCYVNVHLSQSRGVVGWDWKLRCWEFWGTRRQGLYFSGMGIKGRDGNHGMRQISMCCVYRERDLESVVLDGIETFRCILSRVFQIIAILIFASISFSCRYGAHA